MDITSILKYVVEYLRQTAFMPRMHEFWNTGHSYLYDT